MTDRRKSRLVWHTLVCALFCSVVCAEEPDSTSREKETPEQRAERLEWWNSARFGMFVHWGVYSATGGEFRGRMPTNSAEWMMNKARISIADYKTENVDKFNPSKFDARAFVSLAKDAGMKYLVITAKHHDGFSMFHSKCSSYNVVDATPFKRDIMKELADACQEQGIRFGFYYSQAQDWHHPGGFGNTWDKSIQRVSNDVYVREKAVPEVRQLLTEYGPIAIFWWDTPRRMSRESFDSLHSLTKLQPAIITNDRLGEDYPGDYKTFERNIPKQAPALQDWEVCMPISGSWGYKKSDTKFKSTTTLIRNLVDIASKGGNYLLNVSPTGDGTLLPEAVERLEAIGQWMKTNSESIYDTTASPFSKLTWGRCTKKKMAGGTVLYLHVFDWPENGELLVPGLKNKVEQAYLLADQTELETRRQDTGTVVSVPKQAPDDIDSVVVMKVVGTLDIETNLPMPNEDGILLLSADSAFIHNNEGSRQARVQNHEGISNIGYWTDPEAWVEWTFRVDRPGQFEIHAELAVEQEKSRFRITHPGQQESVTVFSTGSYQSYVKKSLGTMRMDQAGTYTLSIKPEKDGWQPINLRQLELRRR